MQLTDLDTDCLLHITDFLSRNDISKLSRTCHSLHDTSLPAILKGGVDLHIANLAYFCRFMHLDSEDEKIRRERFYSLRDLRYHVIVELYSSTPSRHSETARTLTQILHHSCNLVSLSLFRSSVIFSPEQLRIALSAGLPHLQKITLDCLTVEYRDTLSAITSHIRNTKLSFALPRTNTAAASYYVNPIPFVQCHRATITTLTIFQVALSDFDVPLPNVRVLTVLSLCLADDETGWAGPLVHLFPNVERIQLSSLYARDGSSPMRGLDPPNASALREADRWRGRAKAWQARRGTWAHALRFLCVRSMMALYCLGISCRIDRVDVLNPTPSRSVTVAALADAQPRSMTVRISTAGDVESVVSALLPAVALTPSVTHLMIELGDYLLQDLDLGDLCVRLRNHLRDTAVSHLYLHICDRQFPRRDVLLGEPLADGPPNPAPADMGGSLDNAPEVVQVLARDNAALRRIFVTTADSEEVTAWEDRRVGGETSAHWQPLDQLRAREIMAVEGLVEM